MKKASIEIHPLPSNDELLRKEVGQLSLDIYHTDSEIVVLAPIAGVKKDDIHVSVTDEVLVIRGRRQNREEVPEENYYTRECFWGDFSRSILLPKEADSKNISATFEDNILEIRIPKTEIERTKVIKIKA